jgi:hypothetical protein
MTVKTLKVGKACEKQEGKAVEMGTGQKMKVETGTLRGKDRWSLMCLCAVYVKLMIRWVCNDLTVVWLKKKAFRSKKPVVM